jgi:cobalt transporter subunit CbtB
LTANTTFGEEELMPVAAVEVQPHGGLPATGFRAAARSEALIAAAMAAVLGVFVIWGIGFAPIGVLHNAAHDTRHSMAFPCH